MGRCRAARSGTTNVTETVLVVPCYNEAERLPIESFERFASSHPEVQLLFVDDGSTDRTAELLSDLETRAGERVSVLGLTRNQGKAEAVRRGMLAALRGRPRFAGYWDADLATPLEELEGFIGVLTGQPDLEMVFGSRVMLLGHAVKRRLLRHYLGRVFATAASITLGLAIYDTQCGAKLFRVSDDTASLFEEPFLTGWIFDVEIIARLIRERRGTARPQAQDVIYEQPLGTWQDIAGSKVRARDLPRALLELIRIRLRVLGSA